MVVAGGSGRASRPQRPPGSPAPWADEPVGYGQWNSQSQTIVFHPDKDAAGPRRTAILRIVGDSEQDLEVYAADEQPAPATPVTPAAPANQPADNTPPAGNANPNRPENPSAPPASPNSRR